MKYLSVCAGIEAATCAWHHMGWEPVAFSEIEKFPSAVLAHHYPNVPNWGDMTKYKEWPDANVDVLVGGTPCQSFSVAGLRKGLDDPRGNLMLTFGAIAQRYRPKWLVWENVPGVLSSNGGRDFGAFLGMLAELGYGFAYRVLDAQYFGVPQRRRRVFVCAVRGTGNWQRAAAVLFERHSLSGHPAPSRKTWEGLAKCVTTGVGKRYDPETDTMIPVAHPSWWDGGEVAATLTKQNANGAQRMPDKDNFGAVLVQPMAVDFRHTDLTGDTAHTIQAKKTGGFSLNYQPGVMQAMQVRRLTPVECERLQGFPDGYTNIPWRGKPESSDGPRYKALGNSMAVPVMRWIGERINEVSKL